MTYLRTPRFWLLTTAALVLGSHVTASAQGAPTMVAAAPSLPTIPAEQIARDVTSDLNPRTGRRELVAAPFDPFEDDPTLAASLRLRSADGAVAIDGRPLQDGALVEIDFYYNSPSDDPYGGRNYSDAGFINGDLAPVVLRDTRILECSTRVDNVVYDHASYYGGGVSTGIYRPYRHYAGHSSFGFGFGNNYFGPGFGFSNGRSSFNGGTGFNSGLGLNRGSSFNGSSFFGGRSSRGNRSTRPNTRRRAIDRNRDRDGADGRRDRRDINDGRTDGRRDSVAPVRELTDRENEERLRRLRSYWSSGPAAGARRTGRGANSNRVGNTQSRLDIAAPTTSSSAVQASGSEAQASSSSSVQSETRQARPRRNARQNSETPRAERRRSETTRNEPRRQSSTRSNTRPKKARTSSPRRQISPGSIKRRLNFFPNDGYGGRSVVTTRSVDCAREDKLRVFIPNDRLDAARFDGLTLIALDAQGGETPIYLPPNYIEGFRLAATGQVRPQGFQSAPQIAPPQHSTSLPRNRIEAAPCPAGTSKQVDGTCLQTGVVGYPTR